MNTGVPEVIASRSRSTQLSTPMKSFQFLLLTFLSFWMVGSVAGHGERDGRLSDEEMRLIEAYRRNPEPFRRVMHEEERQWEGQHQHRQQNIPLGPRDVVDVRIEGGSIGFSGRNYAYDPVSFRIARGQEMEIIFRRERSSSETSVIVGFRSDGLHFDIPEQRPGTRGQEHGYFVIGEDPRWNTGEPIAQNDKIRAQYSRSKADHVTFSLKYASTR